MRMESLSSGLPQSIPSTFNEASFGGASYSNWLLIICLIMVYIPICYWAFYIFFNMGKGIIKFKKLNPSAKVLEPFGDSAGIDLGCVELCELNPLSGGNKFGIKTGVAVEIPKGYCGILVFRSGQYSRLISDYTLSCTPGIIDADYRGELMYIFKATPDSNEIEKFNAGLLDYYPLQLVIIRNLPSVILKTVEELSKTKRGTGGYGSTTGRQ